MNIIALSLILFLSANFFFMVSIYYRRNDIADLAWGMNFVILAWSAFFLSGFSWLSLGVNWLVTLWWLRLAWHIGMRLQRRDEDERYRTYRLEWRHFFLRSYFQVFILQGILLFLISSSIIFINLSVSNIIPLTAWIGWIVWSIWFYCEYRADRELRIFRESPENRGKVLQTGLWKYSRHPNYFWEVTQWWGLWIIATSLPWGLFTIISPITITILILFVSGIPLLEKKYEHRGDYEAYKKKTSVFIPLPPRNVKE